MKKIPVIIDCDPGTDDALMLLLAFAAKNIDVLAVTAAAGNLNVHQTSLNAMKILNFLGKTEIPVAAGAEKPLARECRLAGRMHGNTGLGTLELLPPSFKIQEKKAVDLTGGILQTLHERPEKYEKVTLICTAPLTNIALLLEKYPECKSKIEKIILMGGGINHGNCTPAAEFNMLFDPEAAQIVFSSGIPIVMCALDMTEKAFISFEEIKELRQIPRKAASMACELLEFMEIFHKKIGHSGVFLHDPTTIVFLLHPDFFTVQEFSIEIENQGKFTTGMTVADRRRSPFSKAPNAKVCMDIDRKAFINFVKECLLSLP